MDAQIQNTFDVWETRWLALSNQMTAMTESFDKQGFSRKSELQHLVEGLRVFGDRQFHFFAGDQYQLEPSDDFSPQTRLKGTLLQIGHDLEILQQAANQRRKPSGQEVSALETADKLARLALSAAAPGVTAVTYFQKSPYIRVIPYADVALIGIPYTTTLVARDYMAIPHEAGHYVFWDSRLKGDKREQKFCDVIANYLNDQDASEWIGRWAEEIFADVYGALVSGPIGALTLQDLCIQQPLGNFAEDDETHPVTVLRPYIYTAVFKYLRTKRTPQENGGISDEQIDALDERWEKMMEEPMAKLSERWNHHDKRKSWKEIVDKHRLENKPGEPAGFLLRNGMAKSLDDVVTRRGEFNGTDLPLNRLVGFMVQQLDETRFAQDWSEDMRLMQTPFDESAVSTLLDEKFANRLKSLADQGAQLPETPLEEVADPWETWIQEEKFFAQGALPPTGTPIAPGKPEPEREEGWIHVFLAKGWNTGPQDQWPKT